MSPTNKINKYRKLSDAIVFCEIEFIINVFNTYFMCHRIWLSFPPLLLK